MNSKLKNLAGFSLIELLISIAILGVILVAVNGLLVASFGNSKVIGVQTNLQEEIRSAAAIINDEVQRAYYVFPPQGSVIKTATTDVTVDWSTFNLGTSNFKTGTHESTIFNVTSSSSTTTPQILAMITTPREPTAPCLSKTKTTPAPTSADLYEDTNKGISAGDGCYQFVAYYAVLRPKVTRGAVSNSSTSSELLDEDLNNTDRLVLMEFRMNLYGKLATTPTTDWGEVGCLLRIVVGDRCTTLATTADPIEDSQLLTNSIPALTCLRLCNNGDPLSLPTLVAAKRFAARMKATTDWISLKSSTISPAILVDYVNESVGSGKEGFKIQMPAETFDARGVFQVRLKLQGKKSINGQISTFPSDPVTVYASPRNIAPLLY
jgi:prepilin-type N-terminal cleavage/methylation domain-containing protein